MKKAILLVVILFVSVISTACINNLAVQELNTKAKGYLDKGDYNNAINRLEASIDLDNTIFETHYNLGIAYTQAERYPEAVDTLKSAIKLRPDFADAYYSLAVAQENFAKGIIDDSIKDGKPVAPDANAKPDEIADSSKQKANDENLTKDEKAQVAQLMQDSITSYSTYLEKSKAAQDKEEVENKIIYLKEQLPKYSSEKQ